MKCGAPGLAGKAKVMVHGDCHSVYTEPCFLALTEGGVWLGKEAIKKSHSGKGAVKKNGSVP